MKKQKVKEIVTSVIAGLLVAGIGFLILHPIAEKERAERREAEKEVIRQLEAEERAYQAEVDAEKARWDAIESENDTQVAAEGEAMELTQRDIEEMDYWGELELLALVVEAEAGNQDLTGKRLVVDVVLNRVDSPLFPNTITEVLQQENQFSTMWNGAVEKAAWNMQDSTYEAVLKEVSGPRLDYDIMYFTAGAYNDYCTPAYIHGDHYFGYDHNFEP